MIIEKRSKEECADLWLKAEAKGDLKEMTTYLCWMDWHGLSMREMVELIEERRQYA